MKRKRELVTLSWEHHDGLVFAFRLQKGLNNNADPGGMRDYVLHTWDSALDHHFWLEEKVLTAVPEISETGQNLHNKMLGDHAFLRAMVEKLRGDKKPATQTIQRFAEHLKRHIRFEEGELFPFIEQSLPSALLKRIGDFLKDHHEIHDKHWPDPFWKNDNTS